MNTQNPALTLRSLATRQNALRLAQVRFDKTGIDQAVVGTGDPHRPFTVEPHVNQAGILDAIIAAGADLDLFQPCRR